MSTENLSSPSSSSTRIGGYSPHGGSRGTSSSNEDPYLIVRREPPACVYSNESFDVEIALELPKTSSPPSTIWANEPIELEALLRDANPEGDISTDATLVTEPMQITLPPAGGSKKKRSCRVTCMIRIDSIRRSTGTALEVRFAPRQGLSSTARTITGTSTRPIQMVNYKIRITEEEEWEEVWYKDEGGRDKSMEIFASILDKEGQIKTGEQIPLLPILCYKTEGSAPIEVANQEILRTLGSNKIILDKDTGKARIRFRVEDVSKNHQGQDFILKVAPDPKSKGFKDIAPEYTKAVNVRSKRNKRSRNTSKAGLKDISGRGESPAVSRPRLMFGAEPSLVARDTGFERQDSGRLREAMTNVINWADEVVNGLYPLQWQVLGYPQHPDGTPDYSRPFHNMPNPNGPIQRILSMYRDLVQNSLRVLGDAVEQTIGTGSHADGYGLSASLPREPADPYSIRGAPAGILPPTAQPFMQNPFGSPDISRQGMAHGMAGAILPGETRAGLHPSISSEAFRHRTDPTMAYASRMSGMHVPAPYSYPTSQYSPAAGGSTLGLDDFARVPPSQSQALGARQQLGVEESRESEVEYVLAKQYKASRTGERLGFPAFGANKDLLGFYRETPGKIGVNHFVPISRHPEDFGPREMLQSTEILEDAIRKKSDAVLVLKDCGTIANLLDRALVYDWGKDIDTIARSSATPPP